MSNDNKKKAAYFILVPFIEYHIAGFVCNAANYIFVNPYLTHMFLGIAFIPVVLSTWFKIHQFFQWKKQFNIFIGILLIIGTILKGKFLVDPPEEWALIYSHSRLNKIFGPEFLIVYNWFLGIVAIIMDLFFFFYAKVGKFE